MAFNGKKPAEQFLKREIVNWGKQNDKDKIGETEIWVLPSTAGSNTRWNVNNYEMIWKKLYQNKK